MLKKTPLILLKIGLVTALAIVISGCGTEDPWSPDPSRPLDLSMVSGPADTVAYDSDISFSWTSTGGAGEVQYQYRLGTGNWSSPSNVTSVAYENVTAGATFNVMATDAGGATDEDSRQFWVGTEPAGDTTPPTVEITSSPVEGSFVATGSAVTFTWDGEDDADGDNVLFWYSFAGSTSDTSATRTVTFVNVSADPAAAFSVWALDQSGNPSTAATVSFVIKDANILYVDDYLFSGAPATERDQKQFYRDILEGYAFAEWDIALQGMPDSSDLVSSGEPLYSTIVFASDGDGADGTWWYDIGEPGGAQLRYYMESGGKLLAISSEILAGIWNNWPPVAGDFEYDWFGILDTLVATYDSTFYRNDSTFCCHIEAADSVTVDTSMSTWDYWGDFTWAVNAGQFPGLPDSMKIDAAKIGYMENGIASNTPGLRDGAVVLFKWGLDVSGSCCLYEYGEPVAHMFYISSVPRSAMLNFDGYRMGLPEMRQTIGAILTEFGE